jgi:hypothetical protein
VANESSFYTAGADGIICMIDFTTGNLLMIEIQSLFKGTALND